MSEIEAYKPMARKAKRLHFEATDDEGNGYCLGCEVRYNRRTPYPCLEVQIADAVLTDR